jgi:hypothetical protein
MRGVLFLPGSWAKGIRIYFPPSLWVDCGGKSAKEFKAGFGFQFFIHNVLRGGQK